MRFKNVTTENRNLNQCSVETVKNTTLCKLHYADDTQLYCVLFGVVVTVYHVNDVYGVTVISDRSGFLPVAWNVYEVCLSDMFLQVQRFCLHRYEPWVWLCCVGL